MYIDRQMIEREFWGGGEEERGELLWSNMVRLDENPDDHVVYASLWRDDKPCEYLLERIKGFARYEDRLIPINLFSLDPSVEVGWFYVYHFSDHGHQRELYHYRSGAEHFTISEARAAHFAEQQLAVAV